MKNSLAQDQNKRKPLVNQIVVILTNMRSIILVMTVNGTQLWGFWGYKKVCSYYSTAITIGLALIRIHINC